MKVETVVCELMQSDIFKLSGNFVMAEGVIMNVFSGP